MEASTGSWPRRGLKMEFPAPREPFLAPFEGAKTDRINQESALNDIKHEICGNSDFCHHSHATSQFLERAGGHNAAI